MPERQGRHIAEDLFDLVVIRFAFGTKPPENRIVYLESAVTNFRASRGWRSVCRHTALKLGVV
jgi:hypothetical protein